MQILPLSREIERVKRLFPPSADETVDRKRNNRSVEIIENTISMTMHFGRRKEQL